MEKKLNKNEMIEETELKEEVKMEELSEETLDEANGGWLIYAAAFLVGAYAGDKIRSSLNRK
ncbi:MAG: hypothetical protein IJV76_06340 [Clostridia bacterium]|nr:hypothetical protein [Clostridia bacterium]